MNTESSSLRDKAIDGSKWGFIDKGVSFFVQFIIGVILARLLPPADFGLLGLAMIVVGFGDVFVNLGLGPSLIQSQKITDRHIRVVLTTSVITGIFLTILIYILAPGISTILENKNVIPILEVLSIIFVLSGLQIPSQALLKKKLEFKNLFHIHVSQSVIYGIITIILALLGYGIWSLVIGNLVKKAVSFVGSYWYTQHSITPLFSIEELKDLFHFGSGMTLSGIFNYFARHGDYFVIGKLLGANSLGLYTKAYTLMQIPTTYFVRVLSDVSFPTASLIQNDSKKLQVIFLKVTGLISFIILPMSLVMCIAAEEIIVGLYGSNWAGAIVPFQILVLFGLFRAVYNNAATFLKAKGWVYAILSAQIIYGLSMIILVWYGSSNFGLKGASIASGLSIFFMFLMILELCVRALQIRRTRVIKVFLPSIIISLFTITPLLLVKYGLVFLDFNYLISVFIYAVVSFFSFLIFAKLLPKKIIGEIPRELFLIAKKYVPKKSILKVL